MSSYDREFHGPLMGPGGEVWRRGRPARRRRWREREEELDRRLARQRLPGHSPRGEPVREIHTYDLDYGWRTGGPFEYSGRAGYSEPYPAPPPRPRRRPRFLPPPDEDHWPRGVFEPRVIDRRRRWLREPYSERYGRYGEDYAEVPPWPEGRRLRRRRRPDYGW